MSNFIRRNFTKILVVELVLLAAVLFPIVLR
jgi:hypothetical protein